MFYTNVLERYDEFVFVGYDDDGNRIKKQITDFKPAYYLSTTKKTSFKSQSGIYLDEFRVPIMEWRKIIHKNPENLQIYGEMSPSYQYIQQNFDTKNIYYDLNKVKVAIIDIEVASDNGFPNVNRADWPITALTIKCRNNGMFYVLSTKDFDVDKITIPIDKNKINFKKMDTEVNLLKSFIYIMKKLDCDVITGWGIKTFDIPYLTNRITKILEEDALNTLSPVKWSRVREEHFTKGTIVWRDFYVPLYDYIELYKKLTDYGNKFKRLCN